MKKLIFTISCSFFMAISAFSQIGVRVSAPDITVSFAERISLEKQQALTTSLSTTYSTSTNTCSTPPLLAGLWQYEKLAFFCKIEVQLEKSVKLPVKFRLGSVDYVDYLEQK